MNTTNAGNLAEQAVAENLKSKGYQIVELNWKTPFAEIDIVAKKDKIMYFIEVKYRSSNAAGDGFDYITPKKLHHMQRASEAWVITYSWDGPYELIAAAVMGRQGQFQIELREV